MRIDLTDNEQTTLLNALESEIKSAKRGQRTSKSPTFVEVWQARERELQKLAAKLQGAK